MIKIINKIFNIFFRFEYKDELKKDQTSINSKKKNSKKKLEDFNYTMF
jgi:hypothetical protein